MKIFLDTAHAADIKKWMETGLVDGITTNPTLLSKEGGDPKQVIAQICALLPNAPISVEVTQSSAQDVYAQAKKIAALADNVVVKIPCHKDYYPVIHRLAQEGVPLNITLVFTMLQGLMMCKLGVAYISPFVGRWDDIDVDGIAILAEMRAMVDTYGYSTQILAASIRHVRHMHDAVMAGADVVTVPVEVLEKAITHPLTDQGIALFNASWAKLGVKQFP